ncbi:hypothetical protein [Nocardioides antri]|uniref:Uncharacterized protein n=1 Tax=Nocardioides antri TaxID=2607659 RepID=A0A5B1M715_9ACTN|nr:hypothetical protein [Nocardioides antri]KAA1427530.1 hypothetical protein F0U47_08695 [Nocardioides antri]
MKRTVFAAACLSLASLAPTAVVSSAEVAPSSTRGAAQVRFGPLSQELQAARECLSAPGLRAARRDVFTCKTLSSVPPRMFYGPHVAVPRRGTVTGTTTAQWGAATALMGTLMAPAVIDRMKDFVKAQDVPWPNKSSSTARKNRRVRYNVYQIWFTRHSTGKKDAWKYGITKTSAGASRPRSQLSACNGHVVTVWQSCKWKWLRTKVVGWYRARAIEATYCARYVAKKGKRPVGMRRCL